MDRLIVFGGTTEGRELCQKCLEQLNNVVIHVFVATEQGKEVLPKDGKLVVHTGRLTSMEMADIIGTLSPDMVVDATHPYATEVTENIVKACTLSNARYIRLLREKADIKKGFIAEDPLKVVKLVNRSRGNVLLTTGSKDLPAYTGIYNFKERVYARILPDANNINWAINMGYAKDHIIAEEGPFSYERNVEEIKKYNIKYLITKESGKAGGFDEKQRACKDANCVLIVIPRPEEDGYSATEVWEMVKEEYTKKTIHIIGVGMGNPKNMTVEAVEAVEDCQVLIGANRLVDAVNKGRKDIYYEYKAEKIKEFIDTTDYQHYGIIFSGDVCLFSGATVLLDLLDGYKVKVIQGISSVAYLASRIGVPWAGCRVVSAHGRNVDIVREVAENEGIFVLTGGNVKQICQTLTENGLGTVKICAGEKLSYPREKITAGYVKDFVSREFDPITVLYMCNENYGISTEFGLSDDMFFRGEIPMTKSEVRSVILSKLQLRNSDIVYDIGSGTGSVTVECGRLAPKGMVYSVECNEDAYELTAKNVEHFELKNVRQFLGQGKDIVADLPKPNSVFIGGSKGELEDIMEQIINKGVDIRFVVSAITLETLTNTLMFMKTKGFKNTEVVQVSVSKGNFVGNSTMMTAQNPIFIVSGDWEE